jgi:hypothetical protein
VLQIKLSRLKELEMFLEEVASEIVLAKRILASWSFAKETGTDAAQFLEKENIFIAVWCVT